MNETGEGGKEWSEMQRGKEGMRKGRENYERETGWGRTRERRRDCRGRMNERGEKGKIAEKERMEM